MQKSQKMTGQEIEELPVAPGVPLLKAGRRQKGAFTLLETMIAVSLMTLLFIGTIELFTTTSLSTVKVRSASSATSSAANAMQLVSDQMKEAYQFILPDDKDDKGNSIWPTAFAGDKSTYKYQWGSGNYQYSGIYVVYPPGASPLPQVAINDPSIYKPVTGTYAKDVAPTSALTGILYFRGDKNHNPKSSGADATYLWAKYPDGTFQKIVSNLASADNSVNFEPSGAESAQFKIVCGEYSGQIGEQTSDRTDGDKSTNPNGATTYTGVWDKTGSRGVQMRNAPPANLQPGKKKTPYVDLPFPSGTPAVTPTPTTPPSIGPSATPSPTPRPTVTPTPTPTPTPSPTPSRTPTPVPTPTPTRTPTPTPTPSRTPTPVPTPTPTRTPTPRPTPTPIIIG